MFYKFWILFLVLISCNEEIKKQTNEIVEYKQGKLFKIHYLDDSDNIIRKEEYYSNGNLKEVIPMKNQLIHGELKLLNENGMIQVSVHFVNGIKTGEAKEYYETGGLKKKFNYKEDKIDGLYQEFFKKGLVKYQCEYKNGMKNGKEIYFLSSGKPAIISNYRNNKLCGEQIKYNNDNSIMEINNYENCIE